MSWLPVLEVTDMQTEFRQSSHRVAAVRGVSFNVGRGEKLGIVGESGCGKSALALSILGLVEPPGDVVAGEVRIHQQQVELRNDRQLSQIRGRRISLVYQDPSAALDPVKTIGHQIGEAVRRHNRSLSRRQVRERTLELLREVDVPNPEARIDSYPHQYSGGMRQRVVIAMAIANEPDVIIADEPTTALDVTTQAQVLALLERLSAVHGTAVILISHNMGVVAEFCDRVLVMYAGRVVEAGPTAGLFACHVHPYTEALLKSVLHPGQMREARLPTIEGMPPALDIVPTGCTFAPRCPVRRERCKREVPHPTDLRPLGYDGMAECHFAKERLEDVNARAGR